MPTPGNHALQQSFSRGNTYAIKKDGPLVQIVRGLVDKDSGSTTTFTIDDLQGFGDNFFNRHYSAWIQSGTNITDDTVVDITDYVSTTGVFTTATAGANYATGDIILIILKSLLSATSLTDIDVKIDGIVVQNTVIDAHHDVPTVDVATNLVVSDVVGNKSDTTGGTSLISLVKTISGNVDSLNLQKLALKTAAIVPQNGTQELFTNTNGLLRVDALVGICTTSMGAVVTNLEVNVLNDATSTVLASDVRIENDGINTMYSMTGTIGNALLASAIDTPHQAQAAGIVLPRGVSEEHTIIRITTDAAEGGTGAIAWYCLYTPLEVGATLV